MRIGRKQIDPEPLRNRKRCQFGLDVGLGSLVEHLGPGTVVPGIRLARGHHPDTLFRPVDQREQFLPFLAERDVVGSTPRELSTRVVAVEQLPVGRSPVVVPQTMLFDDRAAQRLENLLFGKLDAQLPDDRVSDVGLGRRLDVHAIVSQSVARPGEQIHQHQSTIGGEFRDGLDVQGQVVIPHRQIRNQTVGRGFER